MGRDERAVGDPVRERRRARTTAVEVVVEGSKDYCASSLRGSCLDPFGSDGESRIPKMFVTVRVGEDEWGMNQASGDIGAEI